LFTFPAIGSWYAGLAKPSFTPPNWVFGPVWITLYALMGGALFLVWREKKKLEAKKSRTAGLELAFAVFGIQLVLNALWSIVFFGLRAPLLALIEIIALWLSIVACIALFWRVSRAAALLLLPYLAWVTVASALNYFVWVLN
jgi:tryptophan-rich sensory protein